MVTFSLPLVPSGLGVLLTTYVDRYAIVSLLSLDDLGRYSVAFRLASVVGVAMAGVVSAVAPLMYQHHHEPTTPAQIARMFQWFLAAALPLVLFLGMFAPELVRLVAPAEYASVAPVVLLLSATILVASCYNFAPGLWIAKRTGWIAVIGLTTGALNLALNFVLVPRFGLIGAGLSAFGSATIACGAHLACSQRFYPIPFSWPSLLSAGALVAVAGGLVVWGPPGAWVLPGWPEPAVRGVAWLVVSGAVVALLIGAADLHLASRRLRRVLS